MPPQPNDDGMFALPRPGKALGAVMIAVFALWLTYAIGLNWGGADGSTFLLLAGNTQLILHGQVWRLFTAPFLHLAQGHAGVSHVVSTLLGLYFLAPRLEEQWGGARFLRFLAVSAVFAYALQMLLQLALPASLSQRLVPDYWFGASPVLGAIAIAWALTFKNQVVRLMMVVPVTSRMLIVFVVGFAVFMLVAGADLPEGLLSPFGGMLCGYLLGGGTPSPLRKAWLKFRLSRLGKQSESERAGKKPKRNPGGLRVIRGGRDDDDDGRGPDGRWLN